MKNKIIQLIVIGSFLPIFLSSCNRDNSQTSQSETSKKEVTTPAKKWSDDKQQKYNAFKQEYLDFIQTLQPNSELLNLFQEQSKNSPDKIEFDPSLAQSEIDKIDRFSQKYRDFFDSITELELELPMEQQNAIENIKTQLQPEETTPTEDISLASIVNLLDDRQLTTEEICQNIQLPLQIVEQQNDPNCGTFGERTYTQLDNFFTQQNIELNNKINELDLLVEQLKTNDRESLVTSQNQENINQNKSNIFNWLPLIISILGLSIGLLSLVFAIFNNLIIKELKSQNKQFGKRISDKQRQIGELNSIIDEEKQKIQTFENYISRLQNTLKNQSLRLAQLENQNRPHPHNNERQSIPTSVTLPRKNNPTPPKSPPTSPVVAENIRLAQIYQENPNSLLQKAIKVGMTKETTNKILGGVWDNIFMEENRRTGEYFIIGNERGEYYLFLDPHSMFNHQTLSIISKSGLFVCHGNLAKSRKGNEIIINKPATVKKTEQWWTLVAAGEITLP